MIIKNEEEMQLFAAKIAKSCKGGERIYLSGPLGAGKTTFSRGFIMAMGAKGPVKSPTYTLIESYPAADLTIYHLDLYRLAHPEELEFMGFRDLPEESSILLVEWPEKGDKLLPEPTIKIDIQYDGDARLVELSKTNQS